MFQNPGTLILFLAFAALFSSAQAEEKIDFNRDIRPILSSKCFACHGPDEEERGGDLRLDTQRGSREDLGGYAAIAPGDAEDSELIYRVLTDDDNDIMPPSDKGPALSEDEVAVLSQWIKEGGDYAAHWSYEKPTRPEIPQSVRKEWLALNAIDPFIHRRLESEGLAPSPQADRLILARRVALDLTGLPPTWEEAQAFAHDEKPKAYERYVDAQLAKPAYGERWAAVWLDLARYADSAGYADDRARTIWSYRDWVIEAFNRNQPFDQFTIDQIAGDLVDSPTEDQLVATAFHRNTPTNNEGGTNDEEFRNVAVVDRVNTTFEVWMGTTMACAQCHTHKFDPITHAEYFQIFDYFNQSADSDKRDESPLHNIWTKEQLTQKQDLTQEIKDLKKALSTDTPKFIASRDRWMESLQEAPKWTPLTPTSVAADNSQLSPVEGRNTWISQQGDRPDKSNYTLKFPTDKGTVTGLRLKVGKEQITNFVLSQVSANWSPKEAKPVEGRYVRVELIGEKKMIHLAEVEVISEGENIALSGSASQSTTGFGGIAQLAIDGETNGFYQDGSVSHTAVGKDPWFEVDLKSVNPLDQIVIWNRTDKGTEERLMGYRILILDESRKLVWEQSPENIPEPHTKFALSSRRPIEFRAALADYEQSGFPAPSVLEKTLDPKKGWAVGGEKARPHELTLVLNTPINFEKGVLTVELRQQSEFKRHLLSYFQIATTDNSQLSSWARLPENLREMVRSDVRTEDDLKQLNAHYRTIAKELAPQRTQLAKMEKQIGSMKPVTVPIMQDLPADQERESFVQIRGNYKSTGEQVKRDTPAVFHPRRQDLPNDRLALAEWLIDPNNPLTARVTVNRLWEQIFGIGIVQTSEEFGSQGELPTHPELLDWLAVELQENGWDLKAILKLLVTSATYQQISEITPELEENDPFNRFYARAPRFRIAAEMIRDQALFVSGLLSDKMYGKPVNPPQPDLGLKAAFGAQTDWVTSQGEDKFRRGIYTTWRRSSPYASMATFDAPNREVCTSRRIRTNTPLQALVTLNDPVYVEAAQALARLSIQQGGDNVEDQIRYAWRTALIREPSDVELQRVTRLFDKAKAAFTSEPEKARTFATDPIGPTPEGIDPSELAALTLVGNVILNLDELFLKR